MKKTLALIVLALATVANAATTRMASEEWVKKHFARIGIRILDVDVKTNANGTVSYTSPIKSAMHPAWKTITLTFTPFARSPKVTILRAKPSFLDFLFPSAFAASVDGTTVTTSVECDIPTGEYDNAGNPINIHFGPQDLTADGLPEKPDDTHTCELKSDCNCEGANKTESDISIPEDYNDMTLDEINDVSYWVPSSDLGYTQTLPNGTTVHYVSDPDAEGVDPSTIPTWEEVTATDAWAQAMSDALAEINAYMKECRDNYVKSKICDKDNPQHEWGDENECGMQICQRNNSHTKGENEHDFSSATWVNNGTTHKRTCKCGGKTETAAHTEVSGNKQWNSDRTGWTRTDTCSENCGWTRTTEHTCVHVKCKTCSGGDGCTEPCKCNGEHDFKFKGTGKCKRCQCDGCKQTEYELYETRTRSNHTGWSNCGYRDDEVNTRSGGDHCCCECGDYSHEAETAHERSNVAPYREQVEDGEGPDPETEHWLVKKSKCRYCEDPYGEVESHQFDDESPVTYEYIDNDTHQKKTGCKLNCGYKKSDGDPTAHSKGDDTRWEYISDDLETGCREWSTCPSDGGCGKLWSEDVAHTRSEDPDDKCKCGHCKTYQFDHDYAEDACGNSSCTYCGEIEPGTPENHKDWSDNGDGTHTCACTKKTEGHCDWSDWVVESETETETTWVRTCGKCPAQEHKTLPKDEPPENCTLEVHVPLSDACGCICGYYTPGATVTLTNSDRTVGEASEDEKFHHFGGSEDDQNCTCDCEYKHKFKEGCACPKICNKCRAKTEDGSEPTEDDHEPAEHSCGCKCGSLDSSASSVKFHPKCPTTCRCYGANGDGTGQWHYPCGGYYGCERICSYSTTAEYHLANLGGDPVKESSVAAVETDHTKKGDGCGCRCLAYTPSNMTATSPLHTKKSMDCGCFCGNAAESCFEDFHYWVPGNCYCECKGTSHDARKKHKKVNCECENVCKGSNHGSGLADNIPYRTDSTYKTKHDPKDDGCGCKCGAFSGADYPYATLSRFHNGHGTPDCMCEGNHGHKNFTPSECPKVCEICGYNKDRTKNDQSIHEFDEKCVCNCGTFTKDHSWPGYTKTVLRSYECSSCGNTITVYRNYRKCNRRKCDAEESFNSEEGHSSGCGYDPDDPDNPHVHCYCGCVDCICDACEAYRNGHEGGTCTACGEKCGTSSEGGGGGGSGGESGGSGGLDDI